MRVVFKKTKLDELVDLLKDAQDKGKKVDYVCGSTDEVHEIITTTGVESMPTPKYGPRAYAIRFTHNNKYYAGLLRTSI